MNSTFKCAGCRRWLPVTPETRQVGLSRVCSGPCASTVASKGLKRQEGPSRTAPGPSNPRPKAPKRRKPADEVPAATRAAVFLRDNARCRRCGARGRLHLHHIRYRSEGVDHQAHNLIVLCTGCHDWAHANKRLRKPLLLQYIWLLYVEGRQVYVKELEP